MKSRYEHDCDRCVYLGRHQKFDVYACDQGAKWPTVVMRYGKDGDYWSGWHLLTRLPLRLRDKAYAWASEVADSRQTLDGTADEGAE